MRTLLAIGHPQIHQALKTFPELQVVGEVFNRQELNSYCRQTTPELMLVSEILQGKETGDLASFLTNFKRTHPSVRVIYLTGGLTKTNPNHRIKMQSLIECGIYDVYTENELSLKVLKQLIIHPSTLEDVKDWLDSPQPSNISKNNNQKTTTDEQEELMSFSKRKQIDLVTPKTLSEQEVDGVRMITTRFGSDLPPLQRKITSDSSNTEDAQEVKAITKATKIKEPKKDKKKKDKKPFSWKRARDLTISFALIGTGVFTLYMGFKPVFELKTQTSTSVSEWEEAKQALAEAGRDKLEIEDYKESIQEIVSTDSEEVTDIFGLIQLSEGGKRLGLRPGTNDAILDKGAGFDVDMAIPGEDGNAVIYGHREEVFWGLKDLKQGDLIHLETLEGELTFKVTRTFVTEPGSDEIYFDSETSVITLVTCYPFVYMGPNPDRYVVVAERVDEETETSKESIAEDEKDKNEINKK